MEHRDPDRGPRLRRGGGGGGSVGQPRGAGRPSDLRQRAVHDDLRGPLVGRPPEDGVERGVALGPLVAELVRRRVDCVLDGVRPLGLRECECVCVCVSVCVFFQFVRAPFVGRGKIECPPIYFISSPPSLRLSLSHQNAYLVAHVDHHDLLLGGEKRRAELRGRHAGKGVWAGEGRRRH